MIPRWRSLLVVCAAPALLFVALQLRALDHGFVWTDHAEIEQGSLVRPPGQWLAAFGEPLHRVDDFRSRGLQQPYYRPLQVVLVSWLDARFGRAPRTFRAASLALGAVTVALFAATVAVLTGSTPAALVAGAVFAAHPVGLETWVWISGLSAGLAACGVAASLLLGVLALGARSAGARAALVAGSVAAVGLALLAKENAAVAPALLLAAVLGRAFEARRGGRPLVPSPRRFWLTATAAVGAQLLSVLAVFLVVRPRVLGAVLSAMPPLRGSVETQLATALAHWPEALAWLALPLRSNTSDAVRLVGGAGDPGVWLGAALLLVSVAAAIAFALRGWGIAAAGLVWLWVGYLPTSGLVPILHVGAERNLFFALFGLALLWGCALATLRRRGVPAPVVLALALLLVGGLAQRTWVRAADWRSTLALFEADVAADARHREGRLLLTLALLAEGRDAEAKRHADALLQQRSQAARWHSYLVANRDLEIHCLANERVGSDADVLASWDAGVVGPTLRASRAPGYHECAARVLERGGRVGEALAVWRQLHELAEGHAPFVLAIARCEARLGRIGEARRWLSRVPPAAGLEPEVAGVRRLLQRARVRQRAR